MPSLTPAACARSTEGAARTPAPPSAPTADVCRKSRRLNLPLRRFDIRASRFPLVDRCSLLAALSPRGRLPAAAIGRARPNQIDGDAVAVRPVQRVQMLDALAALVEDDALQLDERRSGLDLEGL